MRLVSVASVSLTVALTLPSSSAAAFCRTRTKAPPPDFVPTTDQPCFEGGQPLYWKSACVGFTMQQDGSKQIAFDDAVFAMTAAFAKWRAAACPGGPSSSSASVDVRYLGGVSCSKVEYNTDTSVGNANVIVFRDTTWPHDDPNNTLALTTVTYNPTTGELYDADMEINTREHRFSISDPIPSDGFDFASAVTHEAGHFLGLAHSGDEHATMYARYNPGSTTMRNLGADDVSAICTVYPPDGTRLAGSGPTPSGACDPTPRHGFSSACGDAAKSGCQASGEPPAGGAWLAGAAASLAIAWRKRRATRR